MERDDRPSIPRTPVTADGLRRYDHLPPAEAVRAAWLNPGPNPDWHSRRQTDVERAMPLLARALHRLTKETR